MSPSWGELAVNVINILIKRLEHDQINRQTIADHLIEGEELTLGALNLDEQTDELLAEAHALNDLLDDME